MTTDRTDTAFETSRRAFLMTTGGALAGMAAFGLVKQPPPPSGIPTGRRPAVWPEQRCGGLDAHTHNQNHVVMTTTVMYTGLTDLDYEGNIVPGIAESWEPNKELTAWTFRLRKGVLFHNGREVDAEAVKLNLERIKNPAIGGDWERGAIDTITSAEVLDRYTVRIYTSVPDVSLPTNVMHYPTRLIARRLRHDGRTSHWHGPLQVRLLDAQQRGQTGAF